MAELFERYVVVDWSASARPATGPNSIWIAVLDDALDAEPRLSNPSTRRQAARQLGELIPGSTRTLVVVDASLGYPTGAADWFGLSGRHAWRAMWAHLAGVVVDDERNVNNRFHIAAELNRRGGVVGPFWGRPAQLDVDGLERTKPSSFPVPEYRRTEALLRASGRRPASAWQLLGAGSVGSQTLTLLPILYRLLAPRVDVWPFTTGLLAPRLGSSGAVIAETWLAASDVAAASPVRDADQVSSCARRLRSADLDGRLGGLFKTDDTEPCHTIEDEEGWVLDV